VATHKAMLSHPPLKPSLPGSKESIGWENGKTNGNNMEQLNSVELESID